MGANGQDPGTFIALLFRIVDVPRRTFAAAVLVVVVLAAMGAMAAIAAMAGIRLPLAELVKSELVKSKTAWAGGACVVVLGWLRRR